MSPGPGRTELELDADEIVTAAVAIFEESGLDAVSMRSVSARLGVSPVPLYSRVGNDLPTLNGNGRWAPPVPATYVIDRQGRVAFAHLEADYRERVEPRDVLAALPTENRRRRRLDAGAGKGRG